VGRLIYDMSLEVTHELGTGQASSVTRAEMAAALADLRYLEGYLGMVHRSAEESSLEAADNALASAAGKLAGRVAAIVQAIEEELR
jgi:hypothetical protein